MKTSKSPLNKRLHYVNQREPTSPSDLLIGRFNHGGVNPNGILSLFLGKKALKNSDKDMSPNFADCSPYDYWKDAPIIPKQLQERRIVVPKTIAQQRLERQPVNYQQYQQSIPQQTEQSTETQQKEVADKVGALNIAVKMAFTSKGEPASRLARYPGWEKYYRALVFNEFAGLTGEEAKIIQKLRVDLPKEKNENFKVPVGVFNVQFTSEGTSYSPIAPTIPLTTQEPQIKGQYAQPIGPSRPIGYDTQGKPVFPEKIATKTSEVYIAPNWFGGKQPKSTYETYRQEEIPTKKDFKEVKKVKEVYDSRANVFVSTPYGEEQGTAFIRPPTLAEQKKIDLQTQKETEFYQSLSTARKKYLPTAEERGGVWGKIANVGETIQERIEGFSEKVESKIPFLNERIQQQNSLEYEGQNVSLTIQNFQERYPTTPTDEANYQQYLQELNEINYQIDTHNQNLKNYESSMQEAQTKTIRTLGLFGGGEEFGINVVKGVIETPFTLAKLGVGLVTNPVEEVFNLGRGIKELPGQIYQYPASTLGYLTGQAVATKGAGIIIKKALQPKYSTELFGVTNNLEDGKVATDLIFRTTESRLGGLFKKDYYGKAKGISSITESDGVQIAKTETGGVYSPIAYELLSGKEKALKPRKFGAGSISLSKESPVDFIVNKDISYQVEGLKGFTQVDVGATATAKAGKYYAGMGGGYGSNSLVRVFGKTGFVEKGKVLKPGRNTYLGYVFRTAEKTAEEGVKVLQKSGKTSSASFLNSIAGDITTSIAKNIAKKPTITGKTITSSTITQPKENNLVESNYPTIVGGTKKPIGTFGLSETSYQYQEQDTIERLSLSPSYSISQYSKERVNQLLIPLYQYAQKESLIQPVSFISPQTQTERVNQLFGVSLFQPQAQRQVQRQRQLQGQQQMQQQKQLLKTKQMQIFFPGEQPREEIAYIGFFKSGNKWIKATKPSTRAGALDSVSRIVDTNLSRQFKVLPIKRKIKGKEQYVKVESNKLSRGDNYFQQNMFKFRPYKVRKGQKIPLQSQYIEKTKYALEDKEVPKIQKAKAESMNNLLIGGFSSSRKKKRFRL